MWQKFRRIRVVQDLRQALEELDEALDRLEEQSARPPATNSITLRSPGEIYRTEFMRRLDETIVDTQKILDQAA